jgi:hypothetical protein
MTNAEHPETEPKVAHAGATIVAGDFVAFPA